jgi:hypothetical protein
MRQLLLIGFLVVGCRAREASFDAKASAAYQAAWQKKMAGDQAGYRAGLEEIKKQYPGTRAAERARERLASE